jgi:hypothetical protein
MDPFEKSTPIMIDLGFRVDAVAPPTIPYLPLVGTENRRKPKTIKPYYDFQEI